MNTNNSWIADMKAKTIAQLAQWEEVLRERDLGPSVMTGHPFVVAQRDCSWVLNVERAHGNMTLTPVSARPTIGGGVLRATCLTRADAEAVAALRGDDYEVVLIRDIPGRRIAALKEQLEMLENAGQNAS